MDKFEPKLIFQVDPKNGIPESASISPATIAFLQDLIVKRSITKGHPGEEGLSSVTGRMDLKDESFTSIPCASDRSHISLRPLRKVEIPVSPGVAIPTANQH